MGSGGRHSLQGVQTSRHNASCWRTTSERMARHSGGPMRACTGWPAPPATARTPCAVSSPRTLSHTGPRLASTSKRPLSTAAAAVPGSGDPNHTIRSGGGSPAAR